jgi:hypothetical protein
MAVTGTDLYQAAYTRIAGVVRAGEANITFTDTNAVVRELAAMNVSFQYSQKLDIQLLMGGKVLGIVQPSRGIVSIGALLGTDLKTFLDLYSDICEWNGNELEIEMVGDLTCDSPTLQAEINAYTASTITCHSVLATELGVQTDVRGVLVQANVRLFVLNAEWTTP